MEKNRFYYADDEHTEDDEYWFNNQKSLARLVILQTELVNIIQSLPQKSEDLPDMVDMLTMVNGAYDSLYEGFCRNGMQYDADLVVHDVLAFNALDESSDDELPDS